MLLKAWWGSQALLPTVETQWGSQNTRYTTLNELNASFLLSLNQSHGRRPQTCFYHKRVLNSFDSCLINTVYIWLKSQFDLKATNPKLTVSLEWYLYRLFCREINISFPSSLPFFMVRSPEDDRLCAVCRLQPCSSCGAGSDSWSGSVCSSDPGSGSTGCCCPPAACCAPGWVWMKSAAPSGPAPAPTPAPVWTQGAAQSPSYCLNSTDTFYMDRNLTCRSDAWKRNC